MEELEPLSMILRTTTPRPGVVVVAVGGECDLYEAPRLETALSEARAEGGRVLVDLSELLFIDSSALGVLVKAKRFLEDTGCELVLVAPSREVMRTLSVAGLDTVFAIVDGDTHDGDAGEREADERLRKNATMFRSVNERIRELTRSWDVDELVYFVCECGDERCTRPVGLTLDAFERIVSGVAGNAIVHSEHGVNGWRVLESGGEYLVVANVASHDR